MRCKAMKYLGFVFFGAGYGIGGLLILIEAMTAPGGGNPKNPIFPEDGSNIISNTLVGLGPYGTSLMIAILVIHAITVVNTLDYILNIECKKEK
jgi:hypothetical protein